MAPPARITGRIRGRGGYVAEFYVGRTKIGECRPSSADGSFSLELRRTSGSEKVTPIHLRIVDGKGEVVLRTRPARFSGGIADFQVQLARSKTKMQEPDIYANNLKRLLKAYRNLEGRLDPSDKGARNGLKGLIRLIGRWEGDRRRLEKAGAAEVVQVPKHPNRTPHRHVSTWDQVILPT